MEASRASDIPEKYLISLFLIDSGELALSRSISLWMPIGGFFWDYNLMGSLPVNIGSPLNETEEKSKMFQVRLYQIMRVNSRPGYNDSNI